MATIDEIVSALAGPVEQAQTKGSRSVFVLAAGADAQLAYDVLLAHGFEVKLYEENGRARLHYAAPDGDPEKTARKLAQLMAYAELLSGIRGHVETFGRAMPALAQQTRIAYSSPSLGGADRRITIDLTAVPKPIKKPAAAAAAAAPAPAAKSAATPTSKPSSDGTEADFMAGPQVAKRSLYKAFLDQQKSQDPDSLYRQAINYLKSQRATTAFWVAIYLGGILVVYSFYVLVQAYLCPDLATIKRAYWYCSYDK